jgi:hypothetical protein
MRTFIIVWIIPIKRYKYLKAFCAVGKARMVLDSCTW